MTKVLIGGRTLSETEAGYRNFFLMVLGNKENFVTSPMLEEKVFNQDRNIIIRLLPHAHMRWDIRYEDGKVTRKLSLTPAAYEAVTNVYDSVVDELTKFEGQSEAFVYADGGMNSGEYHMPADAAAKLAQLEAEIEQEEEERKKKMEEEAEAIASAANSNQTGSK